MCRWGLPEVGIPTLFHLIYIKSVGLYSLGSSSSTPTSWKKAPDSSAFDFARSEDISFFGSSCTLTNLLMVPTLHSISSSLVMTPSRSPRLHIDRGFIDVGGRTRANLRTVSAQVGCSLSLRISPKVNQFMEQVDSYARLSTNVIDLKLFIKWSYV
jgi:hypothetical protein